MRLHNSVFLVGSGEYGLSHRHDCSIYLIDTGDEMIMVDSGCGNEPERIIRNIEADGLEPQRLAAVFLTHCHYDHAGGASFFHKEFGTDIYVSSVDVDLLLSGTDEEIGLCAAKRSGIFDSDYHFSNCEEALPLKDSDCLAFGDLSLRVISVRGHSPGSVCFRASLRDFDGLFTGDTLLANGLIGLLNMDGSSLKDFREHLPKLESESPDALLPGHGVFTLSNAYEHIVKALEAIKNLAVPRSMLE